MNFFKILMIVVFLTFLSCGIKSPYSKVPQTLKGTGWSSQFYHYCNFYHFDTDSTGYIESGQVAWSCPVDTLALGISGDQILYQNPVKFRYQIKDSVLVIEYYGTKSKEDELKDKFYYRPQRNDWISYHEYSYGRECLRMGEKIEFFFEP